MKSEFVREDALLAAQHSYLTLNYEAVHREAFEIVAIRNWAQVAGVVVRLPLPLCLCSLPSCLLTDLTTPGRAGLGGAAMFYMVGPKHFRCEGWCCPWGQGCFGLLKTCQLSLNITEYHVTNRKATWQWDCLLCYWFRLEQRRVSIYF